ncbi:MAG: aldo/keto reductase [Bacteroidales bacterium]|nr:aldo/keto reductase [Bacteroidales bacterium]
MKSTRSFLSSRRDFIKTSAAVAAGLTLAPGFVRLRSKPGLLTRPLGSLDHEVTTFGLGGQASIQWTPDDVDPVAIILKAFEKGVNYYDTSNLYGPSQLNYNQAFQKLDLIPGTAGYAESLRRSFFLTSKTHLRFAKGGYDAEGLNNWTNGEQGSRTVDDLKRSLSQLFGDGKGNYPKGAYLNMVLIHSVTSMTEVDAVYEGLYGTDPKAEHIGALAALRDFRDGSNLTGLNPKEEKLVRHIGFSGHYDAGVMMEMIRRDKENLLEGLLVAINSNDKLNFNMQHNVIPVAMAKNMGIIGMKVFADGAMYSKAADWSRQPSDVVRKVGSSELPFRPLVQYTLTTPGISTAIMGIGQISDDPVKCQLSQDLEAAQIGPGGLSEGDREDVEEMTSRVKEGKTNYFQHSKGGLSAVGNLKVVHEDAEHIRLSWNSAYAGNYPLEKYEVYQDGKFLGKVDHVPQTTMEPFTFKAEVASGSKANFRIVTIDTKGNVADAAGGA